MNSNEAPLVSVILSIRNEEAFIERSLGAVLAQDYPAGRLEVLVVDGMSEDRTREIVRRLLANRPNAFLLDNPRRVVTPAHNIGITKAQGEVIVLVGGHAIIPPRYVRQCVETLAQTGADCVGGVLHTISETQAGESIALAQSSRFGVGGVSFRTGQRQAGEVDTVAFGAYRREVMRRIGLFDEDLELNEDDEFNYRLRRAGGRIWLDPSISAAYYARSTWRSLWRQYFKYGLWKVRVFQKVPGSAQPRHWAPPLFVLAVAGGLPTAALIPVLRPAYLGGLVLYAAANLAASIGIARRAGWRHLTRLPLAFATLHLAYGLGFWAGVARFGPPWRQARRKEGSGEGVAARDR